MNIVKKYHSELLKYKNKHQGETCYIFGSGPSFKNFKKQEDGIFIGCNHIIKNEEIKNSIKYYFFGHGYLEYRKDIGTYGNHYREVNDLGNHIEKFCMVSRNNNLRVHKFSPKEVLKLKDINALPCDINCENINLDIENNSFLNHSIVFSATQFALYSGFSKIYLVGCDCHTDYVKENYFWNHSSESKRPNYDFNIINWWKKMYQFKNNYYPGCQIININPDGLKGLMDNDIYFNKK